MMKKAKTDIHDLALKAHRHPDVDVQQLIRQQQGQQLAEQRLPLWASTEGIIYPHHLSLEQCSSQLTAAYKASLVAAMPVKDTMTDLTGGFGVDAAIIGRHFSHLTFVEQNAELCDLARHNLPLLGVRQLDVVNCDCTTYIPQMSRQNLLFIDPARRDKNGRRTFAISDCTPDVCQLLPHLMRLSDRLIIKLSPMLDVTSVVNSLPGLTELHIVSVNNECKELLAIIDETATLDPPIVCVNLKGTDFNPSTTQSYTFTKSSEQSSSGIYTSTVLQYLYEPNASIMKGGCFRSITQTYGFRQLHPNSHLYTSDTLVADFPGRIFRVEGIHTLNKGGVRELQALKKANISLRNFPGKTDDLRKRLHLSDGGDTYLFASTLDDNRRVLIQCRKEN